MVLNRIRQALANDNGTATPFILTIILVSLIGLIFIPLAIQFALTVLS